MLHIVWAIFELVTLVVIGTDCIGSCKSSSQSITTTKVPYHTDEEYVLLKFFEDNHKCVTNINLLLLLFFLFFFFIIGRFYIYIIYKLPFKWYKVPTMLLEKVSIHTEILFVHCWKFFFIITCSFSVFVENCILLPKGIDEFVVFLCIVHVWFWFFILLPRFLSLVIKGQFFPRTKILFPPESAFFFQVQKCSIEIFLSV